MAPTDLHADSDLPASPVSLDPDVARAARGDRGAFERVYRAHVNHVYAICVRMTGARDTADELTQDVFVRVWHKLPQFRGEAAFSTWLHRLAVNVVLETRRSLRRHDRKQGRWTADQQTQHNSVFDDGDVMYAAGDPCDTPLDSASLDGASSDLLAIADRLDLARAMAGLPPGARAVFALHDIEGYKHEEIAEMLGITAGGSKAQLHRARQLLREALT